MSIALRNIGDSIPTECPECSHQLKWSGVDLICDNHNCRQKSYRDLEQFLEYIGRVDNLGTTLKIKFLDEYDVYNVTDLLDTDFGTPSDSDGIQKKLFFSMIDKVQKQTINAADALCSLNIPRLGETTAKKLVSSDYMRKDMFDDIENGTINTDMLKQIVGESTALSLSDNIDKLKLLIRLRPRIVFDNISNTENIKKVAITGSLSIKRSDFEKLLNSRGFVVSDVRKDTICLITDNQTSGSSKNREADKLGIPKMTELEFRTRYNI